MAKAVKNKATTQHPARYEAPVTIEGGFLDVFKTVEKHKEDKAQEQKGPKTKAKRSKWFYVKISLYVLVAIAIISILWALGVAIILILSF